MPHVLLTGGAGFIGSHVAEALLRQKVQLTVLDNLDDFYSRGQKIKNLAEVRCLGEYDFWNCDIREADELGRAIERARPDAIIHLAARAGVRFSIDQPELYERINVDGTRNLLQFARDFKIKRFLFGSSSSVYGATTRVPFCEDDVDLKPISPYAATKLSGEMLCQRYARVYGLSVIVLRLFSVYGPRQRPDLAIHRFTALLEAVNLCRSSATVPRDATTHTWTTSFRRFGGTRLQIAAGRKRRFVRDFQFRPIISGKSDRPCQNAGACNTSQGCS